MSPGNVVLKQKASKDGEITHSHEKSNHSVQRIDSSTTRGKVSFSRLGGGATVS